MLDIVLALLGVLLAISWFYCFLAIQAVLHYRRKRHQPSPEMPFITVMKPLLGSQEGPHLGLIDYLRSFFDQDYPEFEVLLGVETADDTTAKIAGQVIAENPKTPSRLIVTGISPYPNRKMHMLNAMLPAARYDMLVISDSTVRTGPDLLRVISAEMEWPGVELVSCPFRTSAGPSIWSATEAIGWNTEFFASVVLARFTKKLDFAMGKAMAIRRVVLDRIGGFEDLERFPEAESVLGSRVVKAGGKVALSALVVENVLAAQNFRENFSERLRHARDMRRAHPSAYWRQVFLNPLPFALLLFVLWPHTWPVLVMTAALRALLAWQMAVRTLNDPLTRDYWYLVPLQDLAGFAVWIAGWFRFGPADSAICEGLPARPQNPYRG